MCLYVLLFFFPYLSSYTHVLMHVKHADRSKNELTIWQTIQIAKVTLDMLWLLPAVVVLASDTAATGDFSALHCLEFTEDDATKQKTRAVSLSSLGWKHFSQWMRSQDNRLIEAIREANNSSTSHCNGMCRRYQNRKLTTGTQSHQNGRSEERIRYFPLCWTSGFCFDMVGVVAGVLV